MLQRADCRREERLEPVRAIDLVTQILRAARFAHQRGVIHRDLKPQNAIVDGDGVVKVTDFGIARAGASDMTETGSIMGTRPATSRARLRAIRWALSSDMYSDWMKSPLRAADRPHPLRAGRRQMRSAAQRVAEPPPAPSLINSAVPPELDAVVLRALAKDPAARFADASVPRPALERRRQTQLAPVRIGDGRVQAMPPPAVSERQRPGAPSARP